MNLKIRLLIKCYTRQVREIGNEDLKVTIFRGLVAGIWYILLTAFIMYWIYGIKDIHSDLDYLRDRVDVIHYNQTIDGAKFTPWDMNAFHEAWDKRCILRSGTATFAEPNGRGAAVNGHPH